MERMVSGFDINLTAQDDRSDLVLASTIPILAALYVKLNTPDHLDAGLAYIGIHKFMYSRLSNHLPLSIANISSRIHNDDVHTDEIARWTTYLTRTVFVGPVQLEIVSHIYDQFIVCSSDFTDDFTLPPLHTWIEWIVCALINSVLSISTAKTERDLKWFTGECLNIKLEQFTACLQIYVRDMISEQAYLKCRNVSQAQYYQKIGQRVWEDDVVSINEMPVEDEIDLETRIRLWTQNRRKIAHGDKPSNFCLIQG